MKPPATNNARDVAVFSCGISVVVPIEPMLTCAAKSEAMKRAEQPASFPLPPGQK